MTDFRVHDDGIRFARGILWAGMFAVAWVVAAVITVAVLT